jgi:flagellar basal-body rod protein FlgB
MLPFLARSAADRKRPHTMARVLLRPALVNEISDSAILGALGRQMTRAVQRQSAAASNLANIDTPGYHAREATFADALERRLDAIAVAKTADGHMGSIEPSNAGTREIEGLAARRDGNNVQLDRELLALTKASGEFTAAQTALAAKFRLVRYAINEGR